jgi:hypothetical protein
VHIDNGHPSKNIEVMSSDDVAAVRRTNFIDQYLFMLDRRTVSPGI